MAPPPTARRLGSRTALNKQGKIVDANGHLTDVIIRDVSSTGARLETAFGAVIPERFDLRFGRDGGEKSVEVVWRDKTGVGVRYVNVAESEDWIVPKVALPAPEKRLSVMQLRNLAGPGRR